MVPFETSAGQRTVNKQELKGKLSTIIEKYNPEKIILFGSYAAGKPGVESDVDLLIIMETETSTLDMAAEISQMLKHTFPMDIIVRSPQQISQRLRSGDFFIQDVMEKGTILYERTGS